MDPGGNVLLLSPPVAALLEDLVDSRGDQLLNRGGLLLAHTLTSSDSVRYFFMVFHSTPVSRATERMLCQKTGPDGCRSAAMIEDSRRLTLY